MAALYRTLRIVASGGVIAVAASLWNDQDKLKKKFISVTSGRTNKFSPITKAMCYTHEAVNKAENRQKTIFNDPIHGHIVLNDLCVKIIDTPQFQRLRNIKQLGAGYYVYPGASHNRFEHSIGVCHLAGELARHLRAQLEEEGTPELIEDNDILCVEIAGLCHDLGHGPFSHVFDQQFVPEVVSKIPIEEQKKISTEFKEWKEWKHEIASRKMLERLLKENNITLKGSKDEDLDLKLILYLIHPIDEDKQYIKETYRGKEFLFQIVANEKNGIDVDKWDYFARDCHHLGMKCNFDHRRLIKCAKVVRLEKDGPTCIGFRDKVAPDIFDMFYTRSVLHRRAYQHKTKLILEHMLTEALVSAEDDNIFGFEGNSTNTSDSKPLKLSETIFDMVAFEKTDDSVYQRIKDCQSNNKAAEISSSDAATVVPVEETMLSDDNNENASASIASTSTGVLIPSSSRAANQPGEQAKKLLDRIEKRNLYRYLGETKQKKPGFKITRGKECKQVAERRVRDGLIKRMKKENKIINEDVVIVKIVDITYGVKDERDPFRNICFYRKVKKDSNQPEDQQKVFRLEGAQVSLMYPQVFSEQLLRVYCKEDQFAADLKKCFRDYCEAKDLQTPLPG